MSEPQFSVKESEKLAACITGMKLYFQNVNLPYAKGVASRMLEDFNMYQSTAAINRNYNPVKAELIALQAESLKGIITAVENLIRCSEIKEQLKETGSPNEIEKMFNF